jgi:ABC-type transporter Mla subunit MlaD
MSFTKGRNTGRQLVGTLALGMLMAAAGSAGQQTLANSVNEAIAEVNATNAQLAETMKSLNALMATSSGNDLRPAYHAYVQNVEKTRQAADTTKHRYEQMNADSNNYFSTWKDDNGKIANKDIRAKANQRLEEVKKDYKSSVASLKAAAEKFNPFLSDLADVQKALSNDLTGKGIASVSDTVRKANFDHDQVQTEINAAATHLNAIRTALLPVAN